MRKKYITFACVLLACILCTFVVTSTVKITVNSESVDFSEFALETIISRRVSIKGSEFYSDVNVPLDIVSKVLTASFGYTSHDGRTVPSIDGNYPISVYVSNRTACYKFIPETQHFEFWRDGDYRAVGGGHTAPIMLFLVLNTDDRGDIYWGNAESGCAIQNIYLTANALNLGTVCMGGSWLDRNYVAQELGLPDNEEVLYKMPLGYLNPPYENYQNLVPTSRPSSQELPAIQDSSMSLKDALDTVFSSHHWSDTPITKQELSQLLWTSYGYSYYTDTAASSHPYEISRHRTVPSAGAKYPLIIYAINASGIFEYIPEEHTITMTTAGDRRQNIAAAAGHDWMASAPLMIALVWDETRIYNENTTYCEVGLVTQNIYLESAAWGLIADWFRADLNEEPILQALGLVSQTHFHPASIITVGHQDNIPPTISSVSQAPPKNNVLSEDEVRINATVTDDSSGVKQVALNYTSGNGIWIKIEMTNLEQNIWTATIPAFQNGTKVTYIIIAEDNANNNITTQDMGFEYQYQVVPEISTFFIIPLFMITTLLTFLFRARIFRNPFPK